MAISKLPRDVTYTFPNGKVIRGKVIKEVGKEEKSKEAGKDYLNMIQLLKMDNRETPSSLRIQKTAVSTISSAVTPLPAF